MPIELKTDEGVAEITLSGPDGNKLDSPTLDELARTLDGLAAGGGPAFVILTGRDHMFCRGRLPARGLDDERSIRADLEPILRVSASLDRLEAIVVAAVEGAALGFGLGLAVQADRTVVAEGAKLSLPEMSHGIPPLLVMSYLTRHVPYKIAFDLAVSGRDVSPAEARSLGLVNEVVAPGSALAAARAWVGQTRQLPAAGLVMLRQFTRARAGLSDGRDMAAGAAQIAAHLAAIREGAG